MTAPCATGCPFLACPSCPYQGGPSEGGTRHVSAGETACRGVASGPACETMEDVKTPATLPGVRGRGRLVGVDKMSVPPATHYSPPDAP